MGVPKSRHLSVLLDTHIMLWALANDKRLTNGARTLIEDKDHYIAVSIVSVWEVAIKTSVGKLDSTISVEHFLEALHRFEVDILDSRLTIFRHTLLYRSIIETPLIGC